MVVEQIYYATAGLIHALIHWWEASDMSLMGVVSLCFPLMDTTALLRWCRSKILKHWKLSCIANSPIDQNECDKCTFKFARSYVCMYFVHLCKCSWLHNSPCNPYRLAFRTFFSSCFCLCTIYTQCISDDHCRIWSLYIAHIRALFQLISTLKQLQLLNALLCCASTNAVCFR